MTCTLLCNNYHMHLRQITRIYNLVQSALHLGNYRQQPGALLNHLYEPSFHIPVSMVSFEQPRLNNCDMTEIGMCQLRDGRNHFMWEENMCSLHVSLVTMVITSAYI